MWQDNETTVDLLDYEYMADVLKDIICDDNLLPASIGVYGDWGSGKSSLMHMCKNKLESDETHGHTKCLIFNGWLFESYSDAKTALLNSILDEISLEESLGKKAKTTITSLYKSVDKFALAEKAVKYGVSFMTTGGIGLLASLASDSIMTTVKDHIPTIFDNTSELPLSSSDIGEKIKSELNHKDLRDDIRHFQEQFETLLEESKIDRLVIFIDELDRCREDTILDTLEAMRLFMFTGKVAFVIGADERHISYAVKSKFKDIEGIQIDIGKEYLEKLVQYPMQIPRMDIDETGVYIASLLIQADLGEKVFQSFKSEIQRVRTEDLFKSPLKNINSDLDGIDEKSKEILLEDISIADQLAEVLSDGLHGNPRQVKRFLNMMDIRMSMSRHKSVSLNRMVLTKIMMLEYVRPHAFNTIAKMAANNTLSEELAILEDENQESKADSLQQLHSWGKDVWIMRWVKIDPKLSSEELNPYFYFTRTSLDERISRISANLSPKAQDVLDNLLSKSELRLKKALEEDVSDVEAVNILEAMFVRMDRDSQLSTEHIQAFVGFSLKNENRYSTALGYINRIPASKLSMPDMVYFADFAKETDYLSEMKEVAKGWGAVNKMLERAFNNALNA